jgi:hypothetical protein
MHVHVVFCDPDPAGLTRECMEKVSCFNRTSRRCAFPVIMRLDVRQMVGATGTAFCPRSAAGAAATAACSRQSSWMPFIAPPARGFRCTSGQGLNPVTFAPLTPAKGSPCGALDWVLLFSVKTQWASLLYRSHVVEHVQLSGTCDAWLGSLRLSWVFWTFSGKSVLGVRMNLSLFFGT